jgi:hypothetical protein
VAFSRKGVVIASSGFTVKVLIRILLGSDVVVAAGVEALGLSVAVTLGVPAVRLLALQVNVGLDGVQVKPIPVNAAKLEKLYPPRPALAV